MGDAERGGRRRRVSRRTLVSAAIAAPFVIGAISSMVSSLPVLAAVLGIIAIAAPFVVVVALGPKFESTLYQDPNSPINQEFRGVKGVWPYGGGAVAIGFRDPRYGPVFPPVPDDDPHRTTPPKWVTDPGSGHSDALMIVPAEAPAEEPEQGRLD